MGELVATNLKNADNSETVMMSWTQDLAATRASMYSGIKTGDKIMMSFAKARAIQQILKTTKNERLRAELLVVTDPDVAMVELANNPTPDDRVRICAIACMTGFVPGSGEYGIFGGGSDRSGNAKPGKLFIKEAGYRTLFAQLGVAATVEVDHPEYVSFGTAGKKVWRIAGRAYVDVADERHEAVYKIGDNGIDFRLGIAGYESDIIALVTAKARRQMLKQLWSMVSPMLSEEHADDDDFVQPEPTAITNDNTGHDPETVKQVKQNSVLIQLQSMLKNAPDKLTMIESVYKQIINATNLQQLEEAGEALKTHKKSFSDDVLKLVRPAYKEKQAELEASAS